MASTSHPALAAFGTSDLLITFAHSALHFLPFFFYWFVLPIFSKLGFLLGAIIDFLCVCIHICGERFTIERYFLVSD